MFGRNDISNSKIHYPKNHEKYQREELSHSSKRNKSSPTPTEDHPQSPQIDSREGLNIVQTKHYCFSVIVPEQQAKLSTSSTLRTVQNDITVTTKEETKIYVEKISNLYVNNPTKFILYLTFTDLPTPVNYLSSTMAHVKSVGVAIPPNFKGELNECLTRAEDFIDVKTKLIAVCEIDKILNGVFRNNTTNGEARLLRLSEFNILYDILSSPLSKEIQARLSKDICLALDLFLDQKDENKHTIDTKLEATLIPLFQEIKTRYNLTDGFVRMTVDFESSVDIEPPKFNVKPPKESIFFKMAIKYAECKI